MCVACFCLCWLLCLSAFYVVLYGCHALWSSAVNEEHRRKRVRLVLEDIFGQYSAIPAMKLDKSTSGIFNRSNSLNKLTRSNSNSKPSSWGRRLSSGGSTADPEPASDSQCTLASLHRNSSFTDSVVDVARSARSKLLKACSSVVGRSKRSLPFIEEKSNKSHMHLGT